MTIFKAKEKIKKLAWYKQGGAVKPLYISFPWYTCSLMRSFGSKLKIKYELTIFYKNNFMDNYISEKSLEKVAKYYFKRQCADPQFIKNLSNHWHKKYVNPFIAASEKFLEMEFPALSDKALMSFFGAYTEAYTNVWHEAIFLDGFDFYGEAILEKAIKKESKNIAIEDLQILLSPPYPSFMQKERLEILKLAERVFKENILNPPQSLGEDCGEEQAGESSEWLNKKLSQMSKNFYWINNDFASVEYMDSKYFLKKLQLLIKNPKGLLEEKIMRDELKNLVRRKLIIAKKYKLSQEFLNTINFLALLGNFRDERKTYNKMAGNILEKFAKEFSDRAKIPLDILEHLLFWEIKDIFNLKKDLVPIAEKRMSGAFFLINGPYEFDVFYSTNGKKLNNLMKSIINNKSALRGKPAFAGKIKGRVKIIRTKNDFSKIKKGDILVAANTRPDFLPIMKIAGAIITEEGGITCHAAIVSRELKIPAIVGVQGALDFLHDDDLIEVDATSGMIKIL